MQTRRVSSSCIISLASFQTANPTYVFLEHVAGLKHWVQCMGGFRPEKQVFHPPLKKTKHFFTAEKCFLIIVDIWMWIHVLPRANTKRWPGGDCCRLLLMEWHHHMSVPGANIYLTWWFIIIFRMVNIYGKWPKALLWAVPRQSFTWTSWTPS